MPKIFISYRREDSPYEAVIIKERLAAHFGAANVFLDLDSVRLGHNFEERLAELVGQCDYLIAVIGKSWLSACDANGERRLEKQDDWPRIEIQAALKRNVPVIAVLLHHMPMPTRNELPDGMQDLATRKAINIRPLDDFNHDLEKLIRDISEQERERASLATLHDGEEEDEPVSITPANNDTEAASTWPAFTPVLIVGSGPLNGQIYPLEKERFLIGRNESCDLRLDSPSASRMHAQVVRMGDGFLIEDLQSSHGTFVNGDRVVRRYLLNDKDRIHVSDVILIFRNREYTLEPGKDGQITTP